MSQQRGQTADPVAADGVRFEEVWVPVQEGVELRILRWLPDGHGDRVPLVFVAGWVSVIQGWVPVLRALVARRPVCYVETREKRSARVDRRRRSPRWFTIERLAEDLVRVADGVGVADRGAVWFGSSMGSNAILEALKRGRLRAKGAFLVGPNAAFRIPWWGRPILHMPAWWYHVVKYFVIWYVRRFRVDAASEPEQVERYRRTLLAAEPRRLKLSARAVVGYSVWSGLSTIEVPVAIAFAASDTLHDAGEVHEIVAGIPHGRAVQCPSNAYMHDERIVDDIERFIDGLTD